jgi:hypothetical protein
MSNLTHQGLSVSGAVVATDWVLPALFHLLWLGWLTGDLSRPLGYGTILIVAADLARDTGLSRRGGPSGNL